MQHFMNQSPPTAGWGSMADVGHHDSYAKPRAILTDCARRLTGLPVLFVGVRCSLETIMERRNAGEPGRERLYARSSMDEPVPEPVKRWQRTVHHPGIYDLEVDTGRMSPAECAGAIHLRLLHQGVNRPTAFEQLATMG